MREIIEVEQTIPVTFNRNDVKSHKYDKVKNNLAITFPHQLNKHYDHLANSAYVSPTCQIRINNNPPLLSTKCYIEINDEVHTTKIYQRLSHAYQDTLLYDYIMEKNG